MSEFVPPEHHKDAFHCPHCGVYANQKWGPARRYKDRHSRSADVEKSEFSYCTRCDTHAFWVRKSLVYPQESQAPRPEDDMPDSIRDDYMEAREVVNESPRAAAALLRLATEKLLDHVGAEGSGPYQMIGDLVEQERIDARVQQAYDSLRVYGNESVHPGTIDMDDDEETALKLFKLMNFIVRRTITDEQFVEGMYDGLPDSKKEGVEQRDGH